MLATPLEAQEPPVPPTPPTQTQEAEKTAPEAPPQQPPLDLKPPAPAAHRFFHKENKWLFAGVAMTRAADFASTKNFRSRGRDEILLNNDVVDNTPAFVAVQAAGVGTSIGLSYLFHRTGHHKLERWVSILHISVTGFGATRNFMLKTRRPAGQP
jgi:hypothetical protein